jgi:nucleotide-binding universal stress UspA family protein
MTDGLVGYDLASHSKSEPITASDAAHVGLAIRHLLVPLDGSPLAEHVLSYVAHIARAMSARITLLRVLEVAALPMGRRVGLIEWEMLRAEAHAYLAAVAARLVEDGLTVDIELVQGHVAEQIILLAKHQSVDLIVLASHGEGRLHAWNVGSTVQKIIAGAPTSILVVPAKDLDGVQPREVRLHRMLLPLDCSQRAECILPAATELARRYDAELILAHVVPEPEMPRRMGPSKEDLDLAQKLTERNRRAASRYLRDIQDRLAGLSGRVQVRLCVASDRAQTLRELSQREEIDLVILAAHGSTGDARQRYGGLAAKFLQECAGPVIILQDLAAVGADERQADAWTAAQPSH